MVFRKKGMQGLAEDECDLLLRANLSGGEWKKKGSQQWESADGSIKARRVGASILTITTKDFEQHLDQRAKQRASERLQGF